MKINYDVFNSEIFGIRMGNIMFSVDEMNQCLDAKDIISLGKEEMYDHLSVKIPTAQKQILNSFLQNGFCLTDTLLEYTCIFEGYNVPEVRHKTCIRDYKKDDISKLMKIARESFVYDRFHSDPSLDNSLCDKYYEQWVNNSCNGYADKVFVSEYEDEVVGYLTVKADRETNYGHLVLAAVSCEHRGLGIYTSMIYEGTKWFINEGLKGLIVGTQINNIAVQKAWIKLGFTVLGSEYVLHKRL